MLLASTLIPASTLSPAGMEPAGMEPPRIEPVSMMHAMLRMSQPCCEHSRTLEALLASTLPRTQRDRG